MFPGQDKKRCLLAENSPIMLTVNAKPGLYVETTIPSYLAARLSRDPLIAGQQAATTTWWRLRRRFFELCTSQFVLNEAALGEDYERSDCSGNPPPPRRLREAIRL